jgi:hypothetical protein
MKLATAIAAIVGYATPPDWPPGWCGAPMRVQAMLDYGWKPEIMLAEARSAMGKKRDGPPDTINYFEKPFARAHARQAAPLPVVQASTEPEVIREAAHTDRRQPWQIRRDDSHAALAEFSAGLDAAERASGSGGEGGGATVRPGVAAGRG